MEEEIEKSDEEIAELLMEEEYSSISADLLSQKGYKEFLKHLGSKEAGVWVEVASLTVGAMEAFVRLKSLEGNKDAKLHVMWTEHPEVPEGYCVIVFFLLSTLWSYGGFTSRGNLL